LQKKPHRKFEIEAADQKAKARNYSVRKKSSCAVMHQGPLFGIGTILEKSAIRLRTNYSSAGNGCNRKCESKRQRRDAIPAQREAPGLVLPHNFS
jgi:hypothetical protein